MIEVLLFFFEMTKDAEQRRFKTSHPLFNNNFPEASPFQTNNTFFFFFLAQGCCSAEAPEMAGVGYGVTGVEAVVVRSSVHMDKTCCEPSRRQGGGETPRKSLALEN